MYLRQVENNKQTPSVQSLDQAYTSLQGLIVKTYHTRIAAIFSRGGAGLKAGLRASRVECIGTCALVAADGQTTLCTSQFCPYCFYKQVTALLSQV